MVKVKICGITNLEDALLASYSGADAIGMIFTKKSPRYITEKAAKKIIDGLDPFLVKVGVFLDEDKQKVLEIAQFLNLDVLQFHGSETPLYCKFFRPQFKVIKVFFEQDRPYDTKLCRYKVDAFMFDVKYEDKTKDVRTLPQNTLKEINEFIKKGQKIIISGGLNLNNVSKIKKFKPYAVDVASGIEKLVGKKDERRLKAFIKKVKYENT